MAASTVRVLIVIGTTAYGEALSAALGGVEGLRVEGVVSNARQAVDALRRRPCHVVLLDVSGATREASGTREAGAGGLGRDARNNALASIVAIHGEIDGVNIVVNGASEEGQSLVECLKAGATGYTAAGARLEEVISAIRAAARGQLLCSVDKLAKELSDADVRPTVPVLSTELTPRENQVLALIERGLTNKEIARSLGVELSTVKNHIHSILGKLQVRRRTQAAIRRRGILGSDGRTI